MFLTEYNEEKMLEQQGKEKFEEGVIEAKIDDVRNMIKELGISLSRALSIVHITKDEWDKYNA